MFDNTKAQMAALLSGLMLALASGAASSVTFTYPNPAYCNTITIDASGVIRCPSEGTQASHNFFITSVISSCAGLAIDATGAVSCAAVPEHCTLTASPTKPAPGDTITLTASGCTPTPTGFSWTGSGLASNLTTTLNTTSVILPPSATAGSYPYSVIAKNAAGSGSTVGTTVNVATGETGPFAYIAHYPDASPVLGTLLVVDTNNPATRAVPIPVGVYPFGVAVNPAGTRVYVTNAGDNTVSVIDTATNVIIQVKNPLDASKTLPYIGVGTAPYGIAVNPAGTKVYVANSGSNSVSVIDAVSNVVIKNPVDVGNTPYGVAVNPTGSKVYVTNYAGKSVSVINTADDSVFYPVAISGNNPFNKPYGIAVNPNGTQIYVANEGDGTVSVINAKDDTVYRKVPVGNSPRGVAVNPVDGKVYVVNSGDRTVSVIDVTNTEMNPYPVTTLDGMGEQSNFIAFNPAGTLAYVTNKLCGLTTCTGDLSVVDVAAPNPVPSTVSVGGGFLNSFGNFVGPVMKAQATGTVLEFYNTNLDNYFITANANEAAGIDNGSAGPGWSRTGNSFKSGGNTSVCRFYGSYSPGPNSHFYTVDPAECQGLKDQQIPAGDPRKLTVKSWNFESLDFVSTPPTKGGINGTCPTGTTPVYRAYNNGYARGVDSNHRITTSPTAIQYVVNRGWKNEGVVMCSPS